VSVAIVSHVLPPTWSGQSMILARLLEGFDPESYILIRTMDLPIDDHAYLPPLPARTFHLPEAFVSIPGGWRQHLATGRSLARTLRSRAGGIAKIARREGCSAIVACSAGDMLDVPAGYLGARRVGVPFFPYFFDHWSQQSQLGPGRRRFAERVEARLVRSAKTVIVPNEHLARELEESYAARVAIVRNGCLVGPDPGAPPAVRDEAAIVYTGAVYAANHDTFRNLLAAIELANVDARAHVYTAQSNEELAAAGIEGALAVHDHLPGADVPAVQRSADVLFLPLAFDSPFPALIRSSNPGKMGEYLASGRPILAHAPPDSFVAEYFRKHECGVLIDRLDPHALADGLERIVGDDGLRRRVARSARERALADYDIRRAREAFGALVGLRPLPHRGAAAETRATRVS
jgi:glycosyltransferase involved in cell wall biosynthesis